VPLFSAGAALRASRCPPASHLLQQQQQQQQQQQRLPGACAP
jgi:hypothetical protein